MMVAMGPKSDGERLVAAWARQRGFTHEYEPEVGGRCPDFLVHAPFGDFAVEVYEPELRLPSPAGSFSSYPAIRGAFKNRKKKQAKAVRLAGLPYVAALARTNSDISFGPSLAAGAMFGDVAMTFPLGVENPGDHAKTVFGANSQAQPEKNRGISALAIVRRFNPTLWRLDARLVERVRVWGKPRNNNEIGLLLEQRWRDDAELTRAGVLDADARVARMIFLHNPFAEHPLDLRVGGPHDQQWSIVDHGDHTTYEVIAEGRDCHELPDPLQLSQ